MIFLAHRVVMDDDDFQGGGVYFCYFDGWMDGMNGRVCLIVFSLSFLTVESRQWIGITD